MTTLALAIKKLAATAPKLTSAIKTVTTSPDIQKKLEAAEAQNNRDVGQVCLAVCRALVARALGEEPDAPLVGAFLDEAVGDPGFPARAHRLLGEARKTGSWRRRAFLASTLYGLSFRSLADDERDRVDMAVERMMPADAELLSLILRKDEEAERSLNPETVNYFFGQSNVAAFLFGARLRLATTADWKQGGFTDDVISEDRFLGDRQALASLVSLGCIDLGSSKATKGEWQIHQIVITPLGALVIRALDEVAAGIAARPPNDDGSPAS